MKRFSYIFILALFLGLIAVPAFAQDATTAATLDASKLWNYFIVVVMAVLLVAFLVFGRYIIRLLTKLVPIETASSIYASGVRLGFEIALNQAAQTTSPLDDEFFEEMARLRGLKVTVNKDGEGRPVSYKVEYDGPPAVSTPAPQ